MNLKQLLISSFLWPAAVLAASQVVVFDGDPFLSVDARVLARFNAPNWTSKPEGPAPELAATLERFTPGTGLSSAARRVFSPIPPLAQFVLVNQVASDIAYFDFDGLAPAGGPHADLDGNGLPDDWERKYFGRTGIDPAGDADGDGFTNLAEFEAGTDPTDPANTPNLPGLLARWTANGNPDDATGLHPATWVGRASYLEGHLGSAFLLDGANYLQVPDAADLRPAAGFTLAAWVRLDVVDCNPAPILVRPSSRSGVPAFGLLVGCQGPRISFSNALATRTDGPDIPLSAGVWYHLAVTWDGLDLRCHMNGHPVFGRRLPPGFGALDLPAGAGLLLGHDGANAFLKGRLDEVTLANRAFTATEIQWLAGGNMGPRGAVPDGTLLVERRDATLWRVGSDGSDPRFITQGYDARLSADREQLVFKRDQTQPGEPLFEQVWQRDLVSGQETALWTLDQPHDALSLDWAVDGAALNVVDAFKKTIQRREFSESPPVILLDAGARLQRPIRLSVSRWNGSLAWIDDGGLPRSGSGWTAASGGEDSAAVPANSRGTDRFVSWSPDGEWLGLLSGSGIFKVHPDGTGMVPLVDLKGNPGEPTLIDCVPAWSADGTHIATLAAASGEIVARQILWLAADGSGVTGTLSLEGAPLTSVVFAGSAATAAPVEIALMLVPPVVPGDPGLLQIDIPIGAPLPAVEAIGGLGGGFVWQAQPVQERLEKGRRWLELPLPNGVVARFYRLRLK